RAARPGTASSPPAAPAPPATTPAAGAPPRPGTRAPPPLGRDGRRPLPQPALRVARLVAGRLALPKQPVVEPVALPLREGRVEGDPRVPAGRAPQLGQDQPPPHRD